MKRALLFQSRHKGRFGAALFAAVAIHIAAITFANAPKTEPVIARGVAGEPPELFFEPSPPKVDPPPEVSDPLPTPPIIDETYVEDRSTPPPARKQTSRLTPIVKPPSVVTPGSMNLSSAKVLAISAPRPEYPYEARRQKMTGDGIVVMTIDPLKGHVTQVSMAKSTGSAFLDNAALAGFRRWRFKPGTVSSVTCPVTFTLTGASY